jgi:hypothetical protein
MTVIQEGHLRFFFPVNAVEAADTLLKALEGENQRTTA